MHPKARQLVLLGAQAPAPRPPRRGALPPPPAGGPPDAKVGEPFSARLDIPVPESDRAGAVARVAEARPDALAGRRVLRRDTVDGYRFEVGGGWVLLPPPRTRCSPPAASWPECR